MILADEHICQACYLTVGEHPIKCSRGCEHYPALCCEACPCESFKDGHKIILYECGSCDHLHPWDFSGDCRDDKNRYAGVEEYAERNKLTDFEFEVRSMCDRLAADIGKTECPSDPPHPEPGPEVTS